MFVQAELAAPRRPRPSVSCCSAKSQEQRRTKIKIMMLCAPNSTTNLISHARAHTQDDTRPPLTARRQFVAGEMTTTCMCGVTREKVSSK